MVIKTTVEIHCNSGFYCKRNGKTLCSRLNEENDYGEYCEIFFPFLDTDSQGNILKCEKCLLAEREQRKEM